MSTQRVLRMSWRVIPFVLLVAVPLAAQAAPPWSGILDPSRAIDWTSAGFTIPNYTVNCAIQPTLTPNSQSAASANTTAIQNALASCDVTHNVVNIPAGTYYVAGWTYGSQGHQVVRGAGPNSTTIILTDEVGCSGMWHGICMIDDVHQYNGSDTVLPGGTSQCQWTAGYAQGTTNITLSNCGGTPPFNQTIVLDQANEKTDTGGVYICDVNTTNCGYEGTTGGNNDGRFINGVTHSEQQVARVTAVTSLGSGSYSVTISPGVYFSNIRSSQAPGAWWPGFVQNDGLENLTINGASITDGNVAMYDCYQCWLKNVKCLNGGRNHVLFLQSAQDVIRDSYFYGAQGSGSESYGLEWEASSGILVENNIFQQLTAPIMFGQGSGSVIDYNFYIYSNYGGSYVQQAYESHNAGNNFNLFEGNDFLGIAADDAWGSSAQNTYFRNMLYGWQSGKSDNTIPVMLRFQNRAYNIIGNVMGQPGYHTGYQTYPSSKSAVTGGQESTSIYSIGLAGQDNCSTLAVTNCDPLSFSTLMRWGNYDTVTNGVKWDSTEASPAAVPYVNANFTSSYFGSLAHTLHASKPSWWPAAKAWPPVGPDASTGNLGICNGGTYAGGQATAAGQCTGGTVTSAWAAHANSIPALDCYLNVMKGPPDGTGSALSFDAAACYASGNTTPPSVPKNLRIR